MGYKSDAFHAATINNNKVMKEEETLFEWPSLIMLMYDQSFLWFIKISKSPKRIMSHILTNYYNLTDFTVVEHNQMLHGIVPEDFEDSGEFRIPVTYRGGGSLQQVAKLADISANCSQYVRVDCYHVSLWYKGDIWGYWVSRDGSIMTNWGTPTGTRGCECSLDQSKYSSGCSLKEYYEIF